jgi:hypothetical protein
MNDENRIVYSINVEDIQTAAMEEIDRPLTEEEVEIIADKLGDYIKWYDAIADSIRYYL